MLKKTLPALSFAGLAFTGRPAQCTTPRFTATNH